ncbi:60S ribosomal protein L20B [Tilletia horrida]|uniref:60S ribosomal protein L20B n=1 Tax=Tilletia horrida TaxID=155126 RepID=A0AAN6GUK8_9BASI|nr:60S ribosomal protein L20B [Tilletia horrida]
MARFTEYVLPTYAHSNRCSRTGIASSWIWTAGGYRWQVAGRVWAPAGEHGRKQGGLPFHIDPGGGPWRNAEYILTTAHAKLGVSEGGWIGGRVQVAEGAMTLPAAMRLYLSRYLVIGRHLPTERDPEPTLYRMRIFAPNTTVAKSRFWYFVRQLRKMKKATGEIVAVHAIHEAKPLKVKNFGIWLRYNSRSGTHNMYKEIRTMSRAEAVETMYQDMAARHRARFASIHILKVVEIEKNADVRRAYIKQLLAPKLRFPLPHRRTTSRGIYAAKRPSTWC